MVATSATQTLEVQGIGLITGKPVRVEIAPAAPGHGVVFYMEGTSPIPAHFQAAANLDRGVTLANRDGKFISIVEHFLCAAQLAGLSDLKVSVYGAPELPILDGSAQDWLTRFTQCWGLKTPAPSLTLPQALFYRHSDEVCLYALPDTHFKVTYGMNFDHPILRQQWARWDSQQDALEKVACAGTFGFAHELPALQARGLALGANLENSLGLLEDGGLTRSLRHEGEPLYHKILDLIGDLSLTGLNPLTLKAHVFAINAGHSSHVPFAQRLLKAVAAR